MTDPASPSPLPPSGAFMPLVSLRERKWLVLIIILVVAAVGAPLAWFKKKPS